MSTVTVGYNESYFPYDYYYDIDITDTVENLDTSLSL